MFDLEKVNEEWKGRTCKVDVTFEDSVDKEQQSVVNAIKFTEWVATKKRELPYLFPLVFLLKKLLSLHGLNIPYHGTALTMDKSIRWT